MNGKGVIFSFTALMLLLAVLGLSRLGNEMESMQMQLAAQENAAKEASEKFDAINSAAIALEREGNAKAVQERSLPFDYSVDGNALSLEYTLPLSGGRINSFFDAVSVYRAFVSDRNYANAFDGLRVDVNAAKNSAWGGTDTNISFIVQPFCLEARIFDLNFALEKQKCSAETFSAGKVKRIDMNILVGAGDDFNAVSCVFNGSAACPQNAFDSMNSLPYFSLNINDSNCGSCYLAGKKIVSMHFNPAQENSVAISCSGATCISKPLNLAIGELIRETYSGQTASIRQRIEFRERIDGFEFNDFNYSVRANDFNLLVKNRD